MIDINYEYMYRRAKVAYRLLRMFVRSYRRTDGQTNYSIGVASQTITLQTPWLCSPGVSRHTSIL